MNRRDLLKNAITGAVALAMFPTLSLADDLAAVRLAALEREHGGRLGVAALDTGNGCRIAHRGDERFLICSTFKLLLVAVVLKRIDQGAEKLDRRLVFGRDALLEYAPITKQHVGTPGMSIAQLCEATIVWSDNTAANLLLASIGGPTASRDLRAAWATSSRCWIALNQHSTHTTPPPRRRCSQICKRCCWATHYQNHRARG